MPAHGGDAVQVTKHHGMAAIESPDGEAVYFTKSDEGREGLWKQPIAAGEEEQVLASVISRRAFAVTNDGIYFIAGATSDSTYFIPRTVSDTLQFYSFRTRQRQVLAKVQNPWFYLSVSPDSRSILYLAERPGKQRLDGRRAVPVIVRSGRWCAMRKMGAIGRFRATTCQ